MEKSEKQNFTDGIRQINGKGYFDIFKNYDSQIDGELSSICKDLGIEKADKDPLPDYKFLSEKDLPKGVHLPSWAEMKEKGTEKGTFFSGIFGFKRGKYSNKTLLSDQITMLYSSWATPLNDSIIYVGSRTEVSDLVYFVYVHSIVTVNGSTKWYAESGIMNDLSVQVSQIVNTRLIQPEVKVYGHHTFLVNYNDLIDHEKHSFARARDSDWSF